MIEPRLAGWPETGRIRDESHDNAATAADPPQCPGHLTMRMRADSLTAVLALAISGFILFQGSELGLGRPSDPGSGFILFWTGIIMTGLSAALFVHSLLATAADAPGLGDNFAGLRWGKVLYVVALMLLFAATVEFFGFVLTTFVLLLVLFKTVEPQSWRASLLGAVLTTFGAWAVFVAWLGTQLPTGTLFMAD